MDLKALVLSTPGECFGRRKDRNTEAQKDKPAKNINFSGNLLLQPLSHPTLSLLGPKGVINDWRKFKLESEDGDSLPLSKKEMLRQMSSPHRSFSRDDKDTRERFCRKVREAKGINFGSI